MPARLSRRQFGLASLAIGSALTARSALGQVQRKMAPVIPGTGIRVVRTGDDFEAEDWAYYPNHPKSSWNIDDNVRELGAAGQRNEARWREQMRWIPDHITPEQDVAQMHEWVRARVEFLDRAIGDLEKK